MKTISLGFSPCPNDTFIFHGLVHDLVATGVHFEAPQLEDVETLNAWAMEARLDVTKLSFHALGYILDEYCMLRSGSALGRGCGPLLVAREPLDLDRSSRLRVAVPGKYTTAALLFRMFAPQCTDLVEMRFDTIMGSVASGVVDCGVIIHESRFTYAESGLRCLGDLGAWWEQTSGMPVPLGCIAVKRSLGRHRIAEIDAAVRDSLEAAFGNPERCLSYIRNHSQEMEERVVKDHIALYVNDYSLDLGEEGIRAVQSFLQRGRAAGILPPSKHPLTASRLS